MWSWVFCRARDKDLASLFCMELSNVTVFQVGVCMLCPQFWPRKWLVSLPPWHPGCWCRFSLVLWSAEVVFLRLCLQRSLGLGMRGLGIRAAWCGCWLCHGGVSWCNGSSSWPLRLSSSGAGETEQEVRTGRPTVRVPQQLCDQSPDDSTFSLQTSEDAWSCPTWTLDSERAASSWALSPAT